MRCLGRESGGGPFAIKCIRQVASKHAGWSERWLKLGAIALQGVSLSYFPYCIITQEGGETRLSGSFGAYGATGFGENRATRDRRGESEGAPEKISLSGGVVF